MRRRNTIASIVIILTVLALSSVSSACTSILLPASSSVTGSTSVTHTCDAGGAPWELYKVEAKTFEKGALYDIPVLVQALTCVQMSDPKSGQGQGSGHLIPQVEKTNAYIMSGSFGIMNDKQVAIGESTFSGRRELQNKNAWLNIQNLSLLAMQRASNAREAIMIMGTLAQKYGYTEGGEMLAVGDANEAWTFEIVGPGALWEQGDAEPGAYWVAKRVPDGQISATCNASTIGALETDNTSGFMCSPGIVEFAVENGWYDPASGIPFSWRVHFTNSQRAEYSGRRIKRIFSLVNPAIGPTLDETNLPFSVPVASKLGIRDVMNLNRDHYEGTEFDMTIGLSAGPWNDPRRYRGMSFKVDGVTYSWQRGISQVQTEYSIVTQSRKSVPDELGCFWYGPANPDLTCYVPLYPSMTKLSSSISGPGAGAHSIFTRESFRWAISSVGTYADLKWSYMSKDVMAVIDKFEGGALENQASFEKDVTALLAKDKAAAIKAITEYANSNVEKVTTTWWQLLDNLMWKYDAGFVFDTKTGRKTGVAYPEAWLRKVVESKDPAVLYPQK